MDISYLLEYLDPIILGICLMVGYALKNAFEAFPNKYIPLTALHRRSDQLAGYYGAGNSGRHGIGISVNGII